MYGAYSRQDDKERQSLGGGLLERLAPPVQMYDDEPSRPVSLGDAFKDPNTVQMFREVRQRISDNRENKTNTTGIPDNMKQNFEEKSGLSFDDVQVHYNSDKPAQLQALAYTQGNDVYVGPGQEQHLGHELGHVIQQKQGRVRANTSVNGMPVNDNEGMEKEADITSSLNTQSNLNSNEPIQTQSAITGQRPSNENAIQRKIIQTYDQFAASMNVAAGINPAINEREAQRLYVERILNPERNFINRLYERSFGWELDALNLDSLDHMVGGIEAANNYLTYLHSARGPLLQGISQNIKTTLDILWANHPEDCRQLETETRYENGSPDAPAMQTAANAEYAARGIGLNAAQQHGDDYVQQVIPLTVPEFKARFNAPDVLQLMFDIYNKWRVNLGALDRRHADRQLPGVTTDDTPGAIRSFHGDVQNRLPTRNPAAIAAAPPHTATSEAHMLGHANQGPRRPGKLLTEYTGVKLGTEHNPHSNKMVFDYHSGIMYVTFNHYHMLFAVDMNTF